MKLFKQAEDLHLYLSKGSFQAQTKGFVPTMGALHQGHISLLELSKKQCDITICSIFVNPTQFNNKKDFENYPITIGNDILLLEKADCDILFLPQAVEIYPQGIDDLPHYDLGNLENVLEGSYRPGHFQGVCQVVHKLLNIVSPDFLFLGQKDFQQCMVLKRLIELMSSPIQLILGETLRGNSGLAMSSRNQRLTESQKQEAVAIYQMLTYIKQNIHAIHPNKLCAYATQFLLSHGFNKVDYVAIAEPTSLATINEINHNPAVALIAAFIGEVRLIDNMLVNE